jgi:hypothetical protein
MKGKINTAINGLKQKTAGWMNQKIQNYSVRQQKAFVVIFGLLFSGLSVYLSLNTLKAARSSQLVAHPTKPAIPHWLGKTNEEIPRAMISPDLFQRIEAIKSNDSLLRSWPHLLDSIELIEQYYQTNQNP